VISTYMGGTPKEKPALYEDASPLDAVNAQTPPTLMIHGLRDELVWPVHEYRLSERLAAAHRPYYFLKLPWATHACDISLSGPSGQLSLYAIERFLAAVMPASMDPSSRKNKQ
jgi:acetyl esterase/lipase